MKKGLPLFCLLTIFICVISCKKESKKQTDTIQGIWELRKASGSFSIDYPTGNSNTLTFTGNRYEKKENGQIIQSGEFKIITDLTAGESTCLNIISGQYTNRIIYDTNLNGSKIFFELKGNKLTLISGCFALDAGSRLEYERQ